MNRFRICTGVSELINTYDVFIVDVWGVLHDGATVYPGVIDCLGRLQRADRQVIILTNAARRARDIEAEMMQLRITRDLFNHVVSSGELAWQALHTRQDGAHADLGRDCFYIGPERSQRLMDGLDLARVDDLSRASFILNTGPETDPGSTEEYAGLLQTAVAHRLTMLCANPDLEAIRSGQRGISAGALARYYEQLGGTVLYHGKPYAQIYQACLDFLSDVPAKKIVAVGDAVRTDIAGAALAGIDSAFVVGGIHFDSLGSYTPDREQLDALFEREGWWPTVVLPALCW